MEHGLRAIEAARKALAARQPRATIRAAMRLWIMTEARRCEGHRRNRSWARTHPGQRDRAWFKREVAPKVDAFTLREIADATELSLAGRESR
jgi:hypothetical protein